MKDLSGNRVEGDYRLPLVRDAESLNVPDTDTALPYGFPDHGTGVVPDLLGIVLHISRLGIVLSVLQLMGGHGLPPLIEQNETGAGCSLINGSDVPHDILLPFLEII